MNTDNPIQYKSKKFAVRIVKLCQYLSDNHHCYELANQLIRSGTSIGASVAEALCGISRKDFHAKMYIAYKECAETAYWLEIIKEAGYMQDEFYDSIHADCVELKHILSSITLTTRKSLQNS